jgi:outer membrane protein assembly factor BamB
MRLGVVAVLAVLGAVGIAALLAFALYKARSIAELWSPDPEKPRPAFGQTTDFVRPFCSDLCIVDANGDGVPDIALWSGDWSQSHIVVVDGETGHGIWATPTLPNLAESFLHCTDAHTVVVGLKDFTVRAYEAATGTVRWNVKVSDKPSKGAAGKGCVLIATDDEKSIGVSLENGARQSCQPEAEPSNFRHRKASEFEMHGTTYRLAKRAHGTEMLSLTASGGHEWGTELGVYANVPWALFGLFAATDKALVVGGREPAGDIKVALLGVDPATGKQLWKRPFGFIAAENNPSSIDLVVAVKGRVYVGAGRRLRAIDPLTGNDIWLATEPTGKSP